MIANPNDLVRGQPGSETSDPATAVKAIDQFRKAAPSGAGGLKSESTRGGSQ
jgi:pilus assembly protein CpaD